MATTDAVARYVPNPPPSIPGGEALYLMDELQKVQRTLNTLLEYLQESDQLTLTDGITAPTATVGKAKIYVDTSGGDLKVIFGDGTVKTIVVDT